VGWNSRAAQPDRRRYLQQSLNEDTFFIHLTDPGLLAQLRSEHAAAFTLALDQMPAGRAELKIIGLQLAMIGATAADPTFECLLTHGGDADNTRADGTVLKVHAPPAGPVTVAAQITPFSAPGGTFLDVRQLFWGRSPAATWTMTIEEATIDQAHVNLAGLSEVVLQIQVACKVIPAPAPSA
jgi:hypothetical protein